MDNRVVENNINIVPGECEISVENNFRSKQAVAAAHVPKWSEVTRHWNNFYTEISQHSACGQAFYFVAGCIFGHPTEMPINLKCLESFSFTELYFLITKFLANGPFKHVGEVSVHEFCGAVDAMLRHFFHRPVFSLSIFQMLIREIQAAKVNHICL